MIRVKKWKFVRKKILSPPGIEPGSFAWKANIVTI